ncbi:hypothetical protein Y032_0134g1844 [Ancylostoma ceylanicum]|uniref:Uncharacterized protein n=1 Tax=Ancylostoma ceylanicum TaxID=53326 RepID=A0A016T676_9BILA|nr:hypothetical protein Y032_0134g1844 [Ancylostoma ceylanicum]
MRRCQRVQLTILRRLVSGRGMALCWEARNADCQYSGLPNKNASHIQVLVNAESRAEHTDNLASQKRSQLKLKEAFKMPTRLCRFTRRQIHFDILFLPVFFLFEWYYT